VSAIGVAQSTSNAESALGEIDAITDGLSGPVILSPLDESGVHPALHDEIFDQVADFVIDQCRANGCAKTKAFTKGPGGIVFAAAFPG
jgi:hypothetical protein